MTALSAWALRHNIPPAALADLRALLIGDDTTPPAPAEASPESEAAIQNLVRLEASRKGCRLWRNNVGAGHLAESKSFIRFGLANDSQALNSQCASADLIGIRPVLITPQHVGHTVGQFLSREVKHAGWRYTGTAREKAQMRWAEIVTGLGGDARFCSSEGTI